jgi:hypothetical protein
MGDTRLREAKSIETGGTSRTMIFACHWKAKIVISRLLAPPENIAGSLDFAVQKHDTRIMIALKMASQEDASPNWGFTQRLHHI